MKSKSNVTQVDPSVIASMPDPCTELVLGKKLNLEKLAQENQQDLDYIGPAYKTVSTFAGIVGKKLYLKNGDPSTDGAMIHAPFDHKYFYTLVEHEIAHILFQSDAQGRETFSLKTIRRISDAALRARVPLTVEDTVILREFLFTMIGLLEDVRVESLWGVLYPGSKTLMDQLSFESVVEAAQKLDPHTSLAMFLTCHLYGATIPEGKYSPYGYVITQAAEMVKFRSFGTTLLAARWVLQECITEFINKQHSSEPRPSPSPDQTPQAGSPSQASNGSGEVQDSQQPSKGSDEGTSAEQGVLQEAEGRGEEDDAASRDSSQGLLDPQQSPRNPGTTPQRVQAVKGLFKHEPQQPRIEPALERSLNDMQTSSYTSNTNKTRSESRVNYILNDLNANDPVQVNQYLEESEQAMQEIIEDVQNQLVRTVDQDKWAEMDIGGKVTFVDVPFKHQASGLTSQDEGTVQRLRSLFIRVMGKRKWTLQEEGSIIDIPAYIAGIASHEPQPCFIGDDRSRGFKMLVLIDRSGSMGHYSRTPRAERACRIIAKALKFPFVELDIWGFQGIEAGPCVTLTRFDVKQGSFSFETSLSRVTGCTPMHLALRVATKYLQSEGKQAKQILIVTDGMPSIQTKYGREVNTESLVAATRDASIKARRNGIQVDSVLIGTGSQSTVLTRMFGSGHWRTLEDDCFGDGIVRLVSDAFVRYLQHG